MSLTQKYTIETIKRKVMYEENKARKTQLNELCIAIDKIEGDRNLDDDSEATIKLAALNKLRKSQLSSWRQFRTKNGLSNDALVGVEYS